MRRPTYLSFSLLLIVLAVFFPVCGHDFLTYDDNVNIYNNGLITNPTAGSLVQFWSAPYEGLYVPLTYILWVILAKIAAFLPSAAGTPLNPSVFHTANLLVHGLSVVVLFQVLLLLLRDEWAAIFAALLFAIHPVQVEAVAWATGMKDLLSGLFVFLSLWQYLLFLDPEAPHSRTKAQHYGLTIVFFIAAMLAKPGGVVLPLVAGVIGYFVLKRSLVQLVRTLLPLFLLVIPVMIVTNLAQPGSGQDFVPALWQRFFIAGDALVFYLQKLLLPIGLGPDYGRTPAYVLSQGQSYAIALIPYLLIGGMLWKFRHPWVLAATGVFVGALLPVLGFLPFVFQNISTVADRYLYLALLGPALGVGWLLSSYPNKAVRIGAILVALLLAVQSMATISHWKNSVTLLPHVLEVNPRSWVIHNLVAMDAGERGRYAEAVIAGEKSVAANPRYGVAYFNLGIALEKLNRYEEAIAAYRMMLELSPNFLPSYSSLALLYIDRGKFDEAGAILRRGLEIISYRDGSWLAGGVSENRAMIYNAIGSLCSALNQVDQAIDAYRQAIAASHFFPEAHNNLGIAYLTASRYPEAIEAYKEAVALDPTVAAFHSNLCDAYSRMALNDEALASCRMALSLDPLYAAPYLNIGNIMLALNKTGDAIVSYRKALDLAPESAEAAYNLGAVYHSLGKPVEAMSYYKQALKIRPNNVEVLANISKLQQQFGVEP